jgi:hypothetical protein
MVCEELCPASDDFQTLITMMRPFTDTGLLHCNGFTSVPIFMKIYQAVQKLLLRERQTGDLISLLWFLESRQMIRPFTDSGLLRFNAVWTRTQLSMVWRNVLPKSSGLQSRGKMFPRNVCIYLHVHMAYNPQDQHRQFPCSENLKS